MDNQIRPMIPLGVWSIISKEVPADCTMQDDDIRVLCLISSAHFPLHKKVEFGKQPLPVSWFLAQ